MKITDLRGKALPQNVRRAADETKAKLEEPAVDLKEHFAALRDRDDLDLRKSELPDVAVVALVESKAPAAVIAEVASVLKMSVDDLKGQVAAAFDSLAAGPTVDMATLDQAMAAPEDRVRPAEAQRRPVNPFGALREMAPGEFKKALSQLAQWVSSQKDLNEPLVVQTIQRIEELTGVRYVRGKGDFWNVVTQSSDAVRAMLERVPVAFVAGSDPGAAATKQARQLWDQIGAQLAGKGVATQVALVGRGRDEGLQGAAYDAVAKVRDMERISILPAASLKAPQAAAHKGMVLGDDPGEESWLAGEMAKRGVAIVAGGDAQARAEAEALIAREPQRVVLLGGFSPADDAWMQGLKDKVALYVEDAATKPIEAAQKVGDMIASAISDDQRARLEDPLLQIMLHASSNQIADAAQHLQQIAAQNRIRRITTGVANRVERGGASRARVIEVVSELSQQLARFTFGVDNFKDNSLWQARAKEAFEAAAVVCPELNAVLKDSMVDVYFASWSGIQKKPEKASYFESTTSKMPDEPRLFDWSQPHTMLDVDKYRYIRLDTPVADMLTAAAQAGGAQTPEVFLGSEEEMHLYYEAKGWNVAFNTFDSNGTKYLLLTKGDQQKPVIQGVDSPARLTQITALMEQAGVPTEKFVVRGTMDRVRAKARNELEMALKDLGVPVAGAVINNKNESLAALAEAAGLPPGAILATDTKSIGPFTFDVVHVRGHGDDAPRAIVAFKPAYGELTEDLANAVLAVGGTSFLIAGAAGSLVQSDPLGAVHRVTKVDYQGQVVDLKKVPGLELMAAGPGVAHDDVVNVFHPSPMLQSAAWADEMRSKHGAADVDQESGAALFAVAQAKRPVQPGEQLDPMRPRVEADVFAGTLIHNSDVVGKGFLELGTVDDKYVPHVKENARRFFAELGVGAVRARDGSWTPIQGAQAGRLAKQKGEIDVSAVPVPMPDMGGIKLSNEYSNADAIKGEKRVIFVETKNATHEDRAALLEALRQLPPDKFFVAVSASDPLHGDVTRQAGGARPHGLGFETIVVATKAEIEGQQVLGSPRFVLRVDDEAARATVREGLITKGTSYPWEENDAQQWLFRVGTFDRTATPPAHHVYTQDLGRGDAARVGETMRAELVGKQRRIEDALADWAEGSTRARAGETLEDVHARFGGALRNKKQGVDDLRALNPGLPATDDAPLPTGTKLKLRDGPARSAPAAFDPLYAAEIVGDRKVITFSGASAKSWPLMSADDRAHAVKAMRVLAKVLDPKKVFVWTGGTDFGYEKHVHEAFGKRGFPILATGTENILTDLKNLTPHMTHFWTAGVNWFGKSRPVAETLEALGGELIAVGGGQILAGDITSAVAAGVRSHLMAGLQRSPQGDAALDALLRKAAKKHEEATGERLDVDALVAAHGLDGAGREIAAASAAAGRAYGVDAIIASEEIGQSLRAHVFTSTKELLERLGVATASLTPDDLSAAATPELLAQVLDVSEELASVQRHTDAAAATKAGEARRAAGAKPQGGA